MFMIYGNTNEMMPILEKIASFERIIDGKTTLISKNNKNFGKILDNLSSVFSCGRVMPALAVSLHDMTVEDMKTDRWRKLNFSETETVNELPFESLLFRLDDCFGFNLIRETNGRFQGRCIYFALDEKTDLMKIFD